MDDATVRLIAEHDLWWSLQPKDRQWRFGRPAPDLPDHPGIASADPPTPTIASALGCCPGEDHVPG
ncbi:hypothetical protein CKO42_09965 [Lamprobacter modestohalophilus]|uniref:Uncharacterized protein n=1 Tax=Lamprobacter modestohalophilus TaxID=1064514 RepID=A0A9X1B4L6_9GAMM|nr:hypothetical protein [Lamprobacter modestohalophilus]